jgi:non-specific serine/threonine protein kinase
MVFDAIFNRDPVPVTQANAELPAEFGRILNKALEKDRNLRYQTATDLKIDLSRLRRDIDPSRKTTLKPPAPIRRLSDPVAVLFFENLSGREGGRVLPRRHHRRHHHGAVQDQGPEHLLARHGARLPR